MGSGVGVCKRPMVVATYRSIENWQETSALRTLSLQASLQSLVCSHCNGKHRHLSKNPVRIFIRSPKPRCELRVFPPHQNGERGPTGGSDRDRCARHGGFVDEYRRAPFGDDPPESGAHAPRPMAWTTKIATTRTASTRTHLRRGREGLGGEAEGTYPRDGLPRRRQRRWGS